jgi:hypothetical protein
VLPVCSDRRTYTHCTAIYWIETLKTRIMSSTSSAPGALKGNALLIATAKNMYREGGVRSFFRGLPLGLLVRCNPRRGYA